MHAAVQYPDMALLMWEGGSPASIDGLGPSLPNTWQVVVSSKSCERAHCGCRSGCCCIPLSESHDCRRN